MSTRYFELKDGKSSKYWEIRVTGKCHTVRYGRIGTKGQEKKKTFKDPAGARAEAEKLIIQKKGKGYLEKKKKSQTVKEAKKMVKRLEDPGRETKFLKSLARVKPEHGKHKLAKDFADRLLAEAFFLLATPARQGRGSPVADEIIDRVVEKWKYIPKGVDYQKQQFIRNALANVNDSTRLETLKSLCPDNPAAPVLFNLACGWAAVGDKPRMLAAIKECRKRGISPRQIAADRDFACYLDDPDFQAAIVVKRQSIKWSPAPHAKKIKKAIADLVKIIESLGLKCKLHDPVTKADILSFERELGHDLPNDYRALLLQHDGCNFHGYEILGIHDWHDKTSLWKRARRYLDSMSGYGDMEILDCIPLANLDQPNNWLLYDPIGTKREEGPGHLVMMTADVMPIEGILERLCWWLECFEDY